MNKIIIAVIAISMLTGCTISYMAAGKYKDNSDKFIGAVEANIWTGGGTVTLISKNTDTQCTGKAELTKGGVSCTGQGGTVTMNCSDGRVLNGNWQATSCTNGYGAGTDNNGKLFEFIFGLTEAEAQNFTK